MLPEIEENFNEKIRLVVTDLLNTLDNDIKVMLRDHSAKGKLRSGDTIRRTMDLIFKGNSELYNAAISQFQTLEIPYNASLESDIQRIANTAQKQYKSECLPRLQKSTEHTGKPNLYERMLPEVEAAMATDLAKFQNSLNAAVVQLKLNKRNLPLGRVLWALEAILLLTSMFFAVMWFKDPGGNYEPIIVCLGLGIPIVGIFIKIGTEKKT